MTTTITIDEAIGLLNRGHIAPVVKFLQALKTDQSIDQSAAKEFVAPTKPAPVAPAVKPVAKNALRELPKTEEIAKS